MVSVLMTSYNRQQYIAESIESVLASSFTDFELIIVDDASTDSTVDIIKNYAAKDSRIKFYINNQNLGDYPNRNKAASYAVGKYLKYVDSDDTITTEGLKIMVNSMEQYPDARFGLCALNPLAERPFPFMLTPNEAYRYHFFGPGLFHSGPLNAIFLKSAFDAIGGFKTGRMVSDTDMWYRMGLEYPVVLICDGLVTQRRHEGQELDDRRDFILAGEKIKWHYLLNNDCNLNPAELRQIKNKRLKRYIGFMLSGIRRGNWHQVMNYCKCYRFVTKIKLQ
ncbi:glycosyltransferase family 2 protein [soil metagenome]